MPSLFHLTYCGRDGVIFSELKRGHAIGSLTVNLAAGHRVARIHENALPHGPDDPPPLVWPGAFKQVFPGTVFNCASREFLVPLEQLIAPFWHHGPSQRAVSDILDLVRLAGRMPALLQALPLFPKGPSIAPTWITAWIRRRDERWEVIRQHHRFPHASIPDLNWSFLDVIVLAYWEKIKTQGRRESIHFALISGIAETSEDEASFVGQFDVRVPSEGRRSRFFRYLKERKFKNFKQGRFSAQESREIYGSFIPANGDTPLKPASAEAELAEMAARMILYPEA